MNRESSKRPHEDLSVWQQAMSLVEQVYACSSHYPADERFGLTARTLQRLFQRYVGVSPKWVIARYRIHEALERVHENNVKGWASLALDLGYADQAHLTRECRRLSGLPAAALLAGAPTPAGDKSVSFKPPYDGSATLAA